MSNYKVGTDILSIVLKDIKNAGFNPRDRKTPDYQSVELRTEGEKIEVICDKNNYDIIGREELKNIKGILRQPSGPNASKPGMHSDITYLYSLDRSKGILDLEYNGKVLKRGKKVGSGSFGHVYDYEVDGKKVAIKYIFNNNLSQEKGKGAYFSRGDVRERTNEIFIIKNFNENVKLCKIIPYHVILNENNEEAILTGNIKDKNGNQKELTIHFIAMEYMDGNLKDYFLKDRIKLKDDFSNIKKLQRGTKLLTSDLKKKINNDKILKNNKILKNILIIFNDVLSILECLSKEKYYYTDLKPSNILYKCINKKIDLKLGDLGSIFSEDNVNSGDFVTTYNDFIGRKQRWKLEGDSDSNPEYIHVYQSGILLMVFVLDALGESDKILNFKGKGNIVDVESDRQGSIPPDVYYEKNINNIFRNAYMSDEGVTNFSPELYSVIYNIIIKSITPRERYKSIQEIKEYIKGNINLKD